MYNDIIIENFSNPKHIGDIQNPHFEFEVGNPVCGDRIRIQIKVEDGKISQGVFRAWGCATSVATANIFCASIKDNLIETIVKREGNEIDKLLGDLEPSQHHCLDILHELYKKLAKNFTQRSLG